MSNKPVKHGQDGALLTMNELMERVRVNLETAWNTVSPDSEAAMALAEVWTDVQVVQSAHDDMQKLLEDALFVAETMQRQRDLALEDRQFWMNESKYAGIRLVAFHMAQSAGIAIGDANRIINQLIGDDDLPVSEYTRDQLTGALKQMAMELMEESIYRSEADEDAS
jgi:hypothetical protein